MVVLLCSNCQNQWRYGNGLGKAKRQKATESRAIPAMEADNGGIVNSIVHVPYGATVRLMLGSLERNLLPDAVVRRLTRLLLASRLRSGYKPSADVQLSDLLQFAHCMSSYCSLLNFLWNYFVRICCFKLFRLLIVDLNIFLLKRLVLIGC